MQDQKRIYWLTTQFPKGANNRNGIFIYRTVKELSKYYPVTVICLVPVTPPILVMLKDLKNFRKILRQWEDLSPSQPLETDEGSFETIYVKYFRPPRGRSFFLEGYFAYRAVKKKIKNFIPGNMLFHANWLFPSGKTAELLAKKFRSPFLVTLRGSDIHYLEKNTFNFKSAATILKNSSVVTSVSKVLLQKCKMQGLILNGKKEALIHNIYETDKFIIKDKLKSKEAAGLDLKAKTLFYAGGLNRNKNVDIIIKGISRLSEEGYDLRLYIAGSGYGENELRKLSVEKKVSDKVFFLGNINTGKLIDYYNAADLFTLISSFEGLPNVIVESLLCGTPVVASAVGEIPLLVKENINGFLAEPGSVSSFCECVKRALEASWDRSSLRNSMSFLFSENVLKEYRELYSLFGFSGQPALLSSDRQIVSNE